LSYVLGFCSYLSVITKFKNLLEPLFYMKKLRDIAGAVVLGLAGIVSGGCEITQKGQTFVTEVGSTLLVEDYKAHNNPYSSPQPQQNGYPRGYTPPDNKVYSIDPNTASPEVKKLFERAIKGKENMD